MVRPPEISIQIDRGRRGPGDLYDRPGRLGGGVVDEEGVGAGIDRLERLPSGPDLDLDRPIGSRRTAQPLDRLRDPNEAKVGVLHEDPAREVGPVGGPATVEDRLLLEPPRSPGKVLRVPKTSNEPPAARTARRVAVAAPRRGA